MRQKTIELAIKAVSEHKSVSDETRRSYMNDVMRLISDNCRISARSSHYRLRAAWCWYHREGIKEILASLTQLNAEDEQRIQWHVDALQAIPSGLAVVAAANKLRAPHPPLHGDLKCGKKSKRICLGKLPVDWRETIYQSIADPFRVPLAILAVTGCRVSEISRGVVLTWTRNGPVIVIRGSKVNHENGQPWRLIEIPMDHAWITAMPQVDGASLPYSIRVRCEKRKLQSAIADSVEKSFPEESYRISGMSFRHQATADLKAIDMNSVELAKYLGHRSTRTQGAYGHRRYGNKASAPLRASAPQAVRSHEERDSHVLSLSSPRIVSVAKESK
jgi:hypothetical protein